MNSLRVALIAVAVSAIACGTKETNLQRAASSVPPFQLTCGESLCTPFDVEGACSAVAAELGIRGTFLEAWIDPAPAGTTTVTVGGDSFTAVVNDAKQLFDWSASTGVDFVIAGSRFGTHVYVYDPVEATTDTELAPFASTLTKIAFCFDREPVVRELVVSKTASASFKRTYGWSIAKSSPTTGVTLAPGAFFDASYVVTVAAAAAVDAEWLVTGTITITNTATVDATGVSVADEYAGAVASTSCPSGDVIAAGKTVTCTYAVALGGAFDGTNVATVTATGFAPATASATVAFGTSPSFEVDACVSVTDSLVGDLGRVCAAQAPRTFTYPLRIGPYASCDASSEGLAVSNTAAFTAPSGATGSSTWTVAVQVPCAAGCTLTQGYWKTHGLHGPAPFDDAWYQAGPKADDELFAISGLTYHQVLTTPPRGSAWFILAHQYIAAKMNVLNGADPSAVAAELAWAEEFFAIHRPTTRYKPSLAPTMMATADTLDRYNNGLVGPGHCDDTKPDGGGKPPGDGGGRPPDGGGKPPGDGGETCGGGQDEGHRAAWDGRDHRKDERDRDDRLGRGQHRR